MAPTAGVSETTTNCYYHYYVHHRAHSITSPDPAAKAASRLPQQPFPTSTHRQPRARPAHGHPSRLSYERPLDVLKLRGAAATIHRDMQVGTSLLPPLLAKYVSTVIPLAWCV